MPLVLLGALVLLTSFEAAKAGPTATSSRPVISAFIGVHNDYAVASVVAVDGPNTTLSLDCDNRAASSAGFYSACDDLLFQTVILGGTTAMSASYSDFTMQFRATCNYTSAFHSPFSSTRPSHPDSWTMYSQGSSSSSNVPTIGASVAAVSDGSATTSTRLQARQTTSVTRSGPSARCIFSIGGAQAITDGVSVTTTPLDPTDVILSPITVTAGAELLASVSSASLRANPASSINLFGWWTVLFALRIIAFGLCTT